VKRSVVVEVAGQKLSLRTDADEGYIQSLAGLVNEKMAEVKASSRTLSTHVLAILTALEIADDLEKLRKREAELRRRVRDKSRRILELIESAEN
jgi:cell division protein ZapA